MVDDLRLRMLDDLLTAERNFRDLAEKRARALTGVLTELAYRLAGEKLEQMRQLDPSAPSSWKPEEWRSFFLAVSLTPPGEGWGKANGNPPQGGNGHAAEIAALQAKIAALERELARVRERGYEVPPVERVAQVNPLLVSAGEGRLAGFYAAENPQSLGAPLAGAGGDEQGGCRTAPEAARDGAEVPGRGLERAGGNRAVCGRCHRSAVPQRGDPQGVPRRWRRAG